MSELDRILDSQTSRLLMAKTRRTIKSSARVGTISKATARKAAASVLSKKASGKTYAQTKVTKK